MTRAAGRRFGLTVGMAFLALAAILGWREREVLSLVAGLCGGLLAIGGIVVPERLGPVKRAWMGVALRISRVTTPVIMAILFFLVVTPVGLVARAFGHRPLTRPEGRSAWMERTASQGRRSDLARQF